MKTIYDLSQGLPLAWVAEALGAEVYGDLSANVFGICTDTRQGAMGALFFALQGENADGHRFVGRAFAAGAVAAIVSERVEGVEGTQLVVPDTLQALGDLANAYRRQFDIPVIGITGSVGKTSTKEMMAAALRTQVRVLANEKNYNNEIGVPLTLFGLRREHQVAIIEMGMRALGEIDRLAEIAAPTVGVITNIGYAHIERVGSREGIAQAKAELLPHLPKEGVAVLMESEFAPYLRDHVPAGARIVWCGFGDDSSAEVVALGEGSETLQVRVAGEVYEVPLAVVGTHHHANALLALAVAQVLEVPIPQAIAALSVWEGAEGRMTIRTTAEGLTVLDDCYNAGPESMRAALKTLRQMAGDGGVAVLGDMREMGEYAAGLHFALGPEVLDAHLRLLITVGETTPEIVRGAQIKAAEKQAAMPQLEHFATTAEATEHIREWVHSGDTVLVKGSRAMEMEYIVATLTGEAVRGGHD
ncbi:MAG: UDP-N-acetylmuramoyl-tripeptide--D-alanyl-D-alanine ligase [Chthonomonadales bacterium]|nr:UDP-N-acetylmuramoyl-tripeptide--D-alanyl-D-alanine ligase [Chthonomonadales bacterium]